MSSIMRWRSGLMGLSDIAKAPVSHGVEPRDFETGPGLRVPLSAHRPPPRTHRSYRASGLVLTSTRDIAATSQLRKKRSFSNDGRMLTSPPRAVNLVVFLV